VEVCRLAAADVQPQPAVSRRMTKQDQYKTKTPMMFTCKHKTKTPMMFTCEVNQLGAGWTHHHGCLDAACGGIGTGRRSESVGAPMPVRSAPAAGAGEVGAQRRRQGAPTTAAGGYGCLRPLKRGRLSRRSFAIWV
jgi:hypothetical protein